MWVWIVVGMLLRVWIVVIAEFSFGCLCGLVLVCGAGVSGSVFAVVYECLFAGCLLLQLLIVL